MAAPAGWRRHDPRRRRTPKGRILAAAARQLGRHGLRKFTVVDVAADAGMTHPNIYRYFTSKTALLDALVASWLKPLEDRVETVVNATDPVPDKLERMVVAISRAYRTAKAEDPQLFAAFAAASVASRAVSRKQRDAHASCLRTGHRRRHRHGHDRPPSDRSKAQALLLDATWRFMDPAAILARLTRACRSTRGWSACSRRCCKARQARGITIEKA